MGLIKLGYNPKEKYYWEQLDYGYSEKEYNGKLVVTINEMLWSKVKNIIHVRGLGYDSLVLIDGDRRTGKSTIGKMIAYLLNPNLTINNYVAGMEEAPDKLDNAKIDDALVFDEGSLIANSKESMRTRNVQLEKIIDVIGQKRLTLIFCMPTFFSISRAIAVQHSRFLIHTYTDENLVRGRFVYFSTKRKKLLYLSGKKNNNSYKWPKSNFSGRFVDFKLPFEEEYEKLKMASLKETLDPDGNKTKGVTKQQRADLVTELMVKFKENNPEVSDKIISNGFGISTREYYRRKARVLSVRSE